MTIMARSMGNKRVGMMIEKKLSSYSCATSLVLRVPPENNLGFRNIKIHSHWHISSYKDTCLNASQTVPPTGEQEPK